MDTFEALAGNPHIKDYFSRALSSGKVPHALLLTGEAGSGKTMVARAFAARLQCASPKGINACGECRSCRQFAGGNHPDILTVGHEKPRSFGVDDIRTGLVSDMSVRPYSSRYKIYLLDIGDLTITAEAQNAMLKTLEEPPAYGVLVIMVRSAETLLDTIRSRCVSLSMRPVPDETVREAIRGKAPAGADEEVLVSLARGNIGRAVTLAQSEAVTETVSETLALLRNLHRLRADEIQRYAAGLKEKKETAGEALSVMRFWLRDCLTVKAGGGGLVLKNEAAGIEREAARRTAGELAELFGAVEEAERRLRSNVTFELTIEVLLLAMRGRGDK